MRFLTLFLTMAFILSPVYAKDKAEDDKSETNVEETTDKESTDKAEEEDNAQITRYAPDHCDFEMTFPEEPYTSKRCPKGAGKCYSLTGYTMVYEMKTTVDISVTCVPSTPANYKRYSERVIKTALSGMVGRAGITEYSINTQEKDNLRQGALLGSGGHGRQNKIYNAQIWVSDNSLLTVEAKLIGPTHREADAVFGDILSSLKVKKD